MSENIKIGQYEFCQIASGDGLALYRTDTDKWAAYYLVIAQYASCKRYYLHMVREGKAPILMRKAKNLASLERALDPMSVPFNRIRLLLQS